MTRFRFASWTLALSFIAATASAGGGLKVTGNGQLTVNMTKRTFAFTAQQTEDGEARGMGNIQNRSAENHVKFSILCLRVEGNEATMSGFVTLSTDPDFEIGSPIWFRAIDNGEGSKAPVDEMTLVGIYPFGSPAPTCSFDDPFVLGTMGELEGGNIQVHRVRDGE